MRLNSTGGATMNESWFFLPRRRGELYVDPTHSEFFASEALEGAADSLVREAIQNSLDAAEGEPVRVRFALGEVAYSQCARYFEGLWPHVMSALREVGGRGISAQSSPVRFLVIEDENTRGLVGDPAQDEDDPGTRNDFYYFWRNIGRSRKESTDRGRWGLGKSVFPLSSRIGAFWGLTIPKGSERPLLMGLAQLVVHKVDGTTYHPYGYFGRRPSDDLTMPIDDVPICEHFQSCFGLRRRGPGLSIVIPYVADEITDDDLIAAAIRHYFYPIVTGRLVVEVSADGCEHTFDRHTLRAHVSESSDFDREHPLIRLAEWGQSPEPEAVARLSAPPAGRKPVWSSELFTDPADLERLRNRFDDFRPILLDVGLHVEPIGDAPKEARFRLLMRRDADGRRRSGQFIRQGITIENATAPRPSGVHWLVVVEDDVLSTFLGDLENPAHTEWQRRSLKAKDKYARAATTLDFVRYAPQKVLNLLSDRAHRVDRLLLRHIFSLPRENTAAVPDLAKKSTTPENQESVPDEVPATIGGRGTLKLEKTGSGFRLRGTLDNAGDDLPCVLRVEAAYHVLRGNPFRRYSAADFDMEETIRVEAHGAKVLEPAGNGLKLLIEKPDFELIAEGFDRHRDLRVRVQLLEEDGE